MARNTLIFLGEHFEEFINREGESGRYSSTNDVIKAALRLLEEQSSEKKNISKALIMGEKSGFAKSFNPQTHLKSLHNKAR